MNIHNPIIDIDIDMLYIVDTTSIISRILLIDNDFSHPNYVIKNITEIDNNIYQKNVEICKKWCYDNSPNEKYGRQIGDNDCSICSIILEMYNIKLDSIEDSNFLLHLISFYKIDCMNEVYKLGRYKPNK